MAPFGVISAPPGVRTLSFVWPPLAVEGLLLSRLHESMIPPEEEQLLEWSELEAS